MSNGIWIQGLYEITAIMGHCQIKLLDAEISIKVKVFEDLKIVLSMPGTGLISAATIIAEMGDFRGFPSADKMRRVLVSVKGNI